MSILCKEEDKVGIHYKKVSDKFKQMITVIGYEFDSTEEKKSLKMP